MDVEEVKVGLTGDVGRRTTLWVGLWLTRLAVFVIVCWVLGKENMGACELKYSRVARQTSVFEHGGFRSKFAIRTTLKHCCGSATDPSGLRQVLYSRYHCDDELHGMEHSPTALRTY